MRATTDFAIKVVAGKPGYTLEKAREIFSSRRYAEFKEEYNRIYRIEAQSKVIIDTLQKPLTAARELMIKRMTDNLTAQLSNDFKHFLMEDEQGIMISETTRFNFLKQFKVDLELKRRGSNLGQPVDYNLSLWKYQSDNNKMVKVVQGQMTSYDHVCINSIKNFIFNQLSQFSLVVDLISNLTNLNFLIKL